MNSDQLETILDDALASYSSEEPRDGLSRRVMARVRMQRAAPRWVWLHFAVAGLALAGLTLAVSVWRGEAPRSDSRLNTRPTEAHNKPPAPAQPVSPIKRMPRREVPLRPLPMTPEERALMALARQAPEALRQLAEPDKALEIEALNIRPLQIEGLETGEIQ